MITNEWDVKLFKAIERGEIEAVKECLKNGANVNTKNNRNDFSPLLLSIFHCQFETAKYLIDNGADVTANDDKGTTPLHWACCIEGYNIEHYELAKLLIEKGADVNAENRFEETPLLWALSNTTIEYMHNITKLLIENGANVNYKTKIGETPLMMAANRLNIEAIGFLIENGADVNAKDENGSTALNYANMVNAYNNKDKQTIDFLIEKGAKRGITTKEERIKYADNGEQNYLDYLGLDLPNPNIRKKRK